MCLHERLREGLAVTGWVKTKLAVPGAPGYGRSGGERVAYAAADGGWRGGSSRGRSSQTDS